LLRDPELRARLGKRGVEVAREYSWSCIADQIEEMYEQVNVPW
jgi:glycosyltransferase involved in cell wall biosynthesis